MSPLRERADVRINGKRRKVEPGLLFPGWLLREKVNSVQHGATIVGLVFELVVGRLLKLDNLATNSQMDLCPDGIHSRSSTFVESKSCGRGGRFLLERGQLANYIQACSQGTGANLLYTLWQYNHPRPVGNCRERPRRTVGEVIANVTATVNRVFVLDGRIVQAISAKVDALGPTDKLQGLSSRVALMRFSGRAEFTRLYLTIGGKFLDQLFEETETTLHSLGLVPSEWEWSSKRVRSVRFEFNGVVFKTKAFTVFTIQERIPF